jgi:hypothetical protein
MGVPLTVCNRRLRPALAMQRTKCLFSRQSVEGPGAYPPLLTNALLARSAFKQVSFATACQTPPNLAPCADAAALLGTMPTLVAVGPQHCKTPRRPKPAATFIGPQCFGTLDLKMQHELESFFRIPVSYIRLPFSEATGYFFPFESIVPSGRGKARCLIPSNESESSSSSSR